MRERLQEMCERSVSVNIGCRMQLKRSADDPGIFPDHSGNSSLHSAGLAWLLCPLRSVALAHEEIPLGHWMKERYWTTDSLSLSKGGAKNWI